MRERGTYSNLALWCSQQRPALSDFDAAGVPAPAVSSVERCSHLANHQASASHNGITVRSAFLTPRTNALRSEHTILRSRSSQARLCAKNSNSSTSPVCVGDFREVPSVFTVINAPCSPMYSRAGSRRSTLTREVYAAQKAAQMAGQRNNARCQKFHSEAIARQEYRPLPSTKMHPPHQPDQNARDTSKYQVQQ